MKRHAFTLIELLVVISIIALLIGILLPALGAARSSAISIQSKSQLRQFGIAFLTYAADSKDHLPYNWVPNTPPGEKFRQPTWVTLGSNSFQWLNSGPQEGTIYDYVGQADELYRSPALETGELNSGVGSNGKYDYSTIAAFNGANLANISSQAEIHPATGDASDTIDAPSGERKRWPRAVAGTSPVTPCPLASYPAGWRTSAWPTASDRSVGRAAPRGRS